MITNGMIGIQSPICIVTPLPSIGGERRSYRGIAQPFASHSHGHYVVGCVREGRRTLKLNEIALSICPGDLIVFNPGDVHGCIQDDEGLFAYDSLTISKDKLDEVPLKVPDSEEIRRKASTVFNEVISLLDDSRIEEASERILFLASMIEASGETPTLPLAEDAATRAYAHLRGHLANPLSIARLAASESVSEYALIRAYRKRFAITPLQHLMAMRVDCACELLAQGVPPSAVAVETGFSDQAHLTRVFKQRIGTTPAAYLQMASQGA